MVLDEDPLAKMTAKISTLEARVRSLEMTRQRASISETTTYPFRYMIMGACCACAGIMFWALFMKVVF